MNRRDYLGALAGLAAAIPIAGCSTAVGAVPAPRFPESRLDGWERIDERRETLLEESLAGRTIEAKAHAVGYADRDLEAVLEEAIGEIDHPTSVLAASRVAISGDLESAMDADSGLLARTEEAARERFESRLAAVGLKDIQRTGTDTVNVDTGEDARYVRYLADLSLDGVRAGGVTLDSIPVAGDLMVWRHEDALLVAGAAYPAESPSTTIERRDGDPDAVDTGFDPGAYRREIRVTLTGID